MEREWRGARDALDLGLLALRSKLLQGWLELGEAAPAIEACAGLVAAYRHTQPRARRPPPAARRPPPAARRPPGQLSRGGGVRVIYPATHPLLGLQLYTLGNLEADAGDAAAGARHLREARAVLAVTHGEQSRMVAGLDALLAACAAGER